MNLNSVVPIPLPGVPDDTVLPGPIEIRQRGVLVDESRTEECCERPEDLTCDQANKDDDNDSVWSAKSQAQAKNRAEIRAKLSEKGDRVTIANKLRPHMTARDGGAENDGQMDLAGAEEATRWAETFGIRLAVNGQQQDNLLGHTASNSGDVKSPTRLHRILVGKKMHRLLKALAVFSMWFAPMQYAFEPICEMRSEQVVVTILKALHLSSSMAYLMLSFAKFWAEVRMIPATKGWWRSWPVFFQALDGITIFAVIGEWAHIWEPHFQGNVGWAQGLILVHLVKIWRMCQSTGLGTIAVEVAYLFSQLLTAVQLGGSIITRLALVEHADGQDTWVDVLLTKSGPKSCYDFWAASVYFFTSTLSEVGLGPFIPGNAHERLLFTNVMLVGQMFTAKIFADLAWVTSLHGHWQALHIAKVMQTASALQSMGVNAGLRQRVHAYQEFVEKQLMQSRKEECMMGLSGTLREELKLVVYYGLVVKAPFLMEQPPNIVRHIISCLQDAVFLPCDVIIRRGDMGTELFFLNNGHAAVFKSVELPHWEDKEIFLLTKGKYFGEIALLTGQPRASWIIARTYCVCSTLEKSAMDEIISKHPACLAVLVNTLKTALGLKPSLTWKAITMKIREEFMDEDDIFDFTCSGLDGEAAAGILTWPRWQVLATRLRIGMLDLKLLWIELDQGSCGETDFYQLMDKLREGCGETNMYKDLWQLDFDEQGPRPTEPSEAPSVPKIAITAAGQSEDPIGADPEASGPDHPGSQSDAPAADAQPQEKPEERNPKARSSISSVMSEGKEGEDGHLDASSPRRPRGLRPSLLYAAPVTKGGLEPWQHENLSEKLGDLTRKVGLIAETLGIAGIGEAKENGRSHTPESV